MTHTRSANRRQFMATASGLLAAGGLHLSATAQEEKPKSPNERLRVGTIGLRYQGTVITVQARQYADIVALCDVDQHVREQGRSSFGSTPAIFEDYRDMLARDDLDVILIGTPDHWHVKMAVDALRSGKHVYCEKPLTLTIEEGKLLRKVVGETGKVLQVGSWQRSDSRFRLAIELVRGGRIGKLQHVDVVLGKNKVGGPVQDLSCSQELQLESLAGADTGHTVHPGTIALHIPLVVRILRRSDDGLGSTSPRYCSVGYQFAAGAD